MSLFPKYTVIARHIPAAIISIPMLLFYFFFFRKDLEAFFVFSANLGIWKDVPISLVFIFILGMMGRGLGKYIFEDVLYSNGERLPTTELLSWENTELSSDYKDKIRQKIKTDFGIVLLSKSKTENNSDEARKQIKGAIGQIRHRVKDGRLLLNRNIEYGFWRNLIGGSLLAFPLSIYGVFFSERSSSAFILFFVCSLVYGVWIIFSKLILWKHGKNYAETLFEEYLSN